MVCLIVEDIPAIKNQLLTQYDIDIQEGPRNDQSCDGRCDHRDHGGIFTCRCDELCPYYGDCCIDYDFICLNSTISGLNDASIYSNVEKHKIHECVYDPSLDSNVWLIARCPASWKEHFVESRCTDPDLSLRVFDRSGISYFNIFCAFCHGHSLKDIQPWNMVIPDLPIMKHSLVCTKNALSKGDFHWMLFVEKIRVCSQVIHDCPASYENQEIIALCHKYDWIYCAKEALYKNRFCGLCNSASIDCQNYAKGIGELFRFRGSLKAKPDVHTNLCLTGEIYDPLSLSCRPLTCIHGYAIQNNKCGLKNGTSVESILGNWTCGKYDSLFFFKSFTSSLTCVDELLERNIFGGLHTEFMHQASSTDQQVWLAIRFDTIQSLVLFQEIDEFVTNRNNCDIYNDEFLSVCYRQLHDINCSSEQWYSGPPLNFVKVPHPLYNNVYLINGVYIMSEVVMFHAKYERDNKDRLQRKDTLMLCGSKYEIPQPDCSLVALSPQEYIIVNRSILMYRNKTINDTDFSIQPDGQVLVCTDVFHESESDSIVQDGDHFADAFDIVSFVFGCISIICLLVTFVTYAKFQKLRNMYGKCIMCLSATLCLAQLFTILSDKVTWLDDGCIAIAITTHYVWLSMFAWSTNSAVCLLQQFVIDQTGDSVERISFGVLLHLFGWGVPMMIVLSTVIIHFCECTSLRVYGRNGLCWIQDGIVNLVAFGAPVALLILTNAVIFAIALTSLRRARQRSNVMQNKQKK